MVQEPKWTGHGSFLAQMAILQGPALSDIFNIKAHDFLQTS